MNTDIINSILKGQYSMKGDKHKYEMTIRNKDYKVEEVISSLCYTIAELERHVDAVIKMYDLYVVIEDAIDAVDK